MTFVFIGTLAAACTGIYLDRTNRYLFALKVVTITAFLSLITSIYLIPLGKMWAAYLFCLIGGISIVPIIPVSFSLATESTHPVQPALVVGLMMSGAQLCLFFFAYIYLAILKNQEKVDTRICLGVMAINPLICILLS